MGEANLAAIVREAVREELAGARKVPRRHHWLARIVRGLEDDPRVQARVHLVGCIYWLVNFPAVAALYFLAPHLWVALGLLVNTFYSLYANLSTDYDGLSSSQASLHARNAEKARAARNREDGAQ